MKIRRFTAHTMPEALREVRAVLGPDAIILETFEAGNGLLTVVAANDTELRSPGQELAEEGRELASLARTLVSPERAPSGTRAELGALAAALAAQGIDGVIAAALVRATAAGLVDGDSLGAALARTFAALPAPPAAEGDRVQLFVGSPGDGKTTTIVKLAAQARRAGRAVLLVGTDRARVGAARELASYGRALAARCERAETPQALSAILARSGPDVAVFVDTAGATPGQASELAALGVLADAAGPSARRVLVASAATGSRAAHGLCEAYAPLGPQAVVVTKCDAAPPGPLLALLWRRGLVVSHLAHGRHRPDEIEIATPDRLARSVLAA